MYGRVFRKLNAKSKAKGKSSELTSEGTTHDIFSPSHSHNPSGSNDHCPPDESRVQWDEYDAKAADMGLFKLHSNPTHHHHYPIDSYERSTSHDSIFATAPTPPRANTTALGISATGSVQDDDSVDLTIFIDDDQSTSTELVPIYRVRPSLVPRPRPWDDEEKGGEWENVRIPRKDSTQTDPGVVANENSRTYGTNGCRSSLRRTHSGGLDPYLMPPPRLSRFEI